MKKRLKRIGLPTRASFNIALLGLILFMSLAVHAAALSPEHLSVDCGVPTNPGTIGDLARGGLSRETRSSFQKRYDIEQRIAESRPNTTRFFASNWIGITLTGKRISRAHMMAVRGKQGHETVIVVAVKGANPSWKVTVELRTKQRYTGNDGVQHVRSTEAIRRDSWRKTQAGLLIVSSKVVSGRILLDGRLLPRPK